MTRGEIITTALELAGDTGLGTQAIDWLELWLERMYGSYCWPFLKRRFTLTGIAAGNRSTDVGDGSGGVTEKIQLIHYIYMADTATLTNRSYLWVNDASGGAPEDEPGFLLTSELGQPLRAQVEKAGTMGKWTLIWEGLLPAEGKTLVMAAHPFVARLADANAVPAYPNTDTMVQAVYARALQHMNDEREPMAFAKLAGMETADRVVYGRQHGGNRIRLSRKRFPRTRY